MVNKIITLLGAIGQLLVALMAVRDALNLANSVEEQEIDYENPLEADIDE